MGLLFEKMVCFIIFFWFILILMHLLFILLTSNNCLLFERNVTYLTLSKTVRLLNFDTKCFTILFVNAIISYDRKLLTTSKTSLMCKHNNTGMRLVIVLISRE